MPLADQVDNESWMVLNPTDGEPGDLDGMLSKFQQFMVQPSGVEGVATTATATSNTREPSPVKPSAKIRPRIFMNILHAVLKGEKLSFSADEATDPFFFQEDYDLMERVDADDDGDSNVNEMKGIMVSSRDVSLRNYIGVVVSKRLRLYHCISERHGRRTQGYDKISSIGYFR